MLWSDMLNMSKDLCQHCLSTVFNLNHSFSLQQLWQGNFNSLWCSDVIWQHRTGWILARLVSCHLTAPSHYLNQCWLLSGEVLCHSPKNNFIALAQDTITLYNDNEFENHILKLLPHLPGASEFFFVSSRKTITCLSDIVNYNQAWQWPQGWGMFGWS